MYNGVLLATQDLIREATTQLILRRGELLAQIKEFKAYEGTAETFYEYLAQKDARKDAKMCIQLYKFYVVKHKLLAEDIRDIHYLRLLEIMKVATNDSLKGWLEECRHLSWKDLINEVRGARKKAPMTSESPKDFSLLPGSPCILCGSTPTDYDNYKKKIGKYLATGKNVTKTGHFRDKNGSKHDRA